MHAIHFSCCYCLKSSRDLVSVWCSSLVHDSVAADHVVQRRMVLANISKPESLEAILTINLLKRLNTADSFGSLGRILRYIWHPYESFDLTRPFKNITSFWIHVRVLQQYIRYWRKLLQTQLCTVSLFSILRKLVLIIERTILINGLEMSRFLEKKMKKKISLISLESSSTCPSTNADYFLCENCLFFAITQACKCLYPRSCLH